MTSPTDHVQISHCMLDLHTLNIISYLQLIISQLERSFDHQAIYQLFSLLLKSVNRSEKGSTSAQAGLPTISTDCYAAGFDFLQFSFHS